MSFKSAIEWVRKNCKFAIDLTQAPADWESNDSAMRSMLPKPQPAAEPNPDEENKYRQTLDAMQIVQNGTKESWDYADVAMPGSGGQISPRYQSYKIDYLKGPIVVEGPVYYPDSLAAIWGPIDDVFANFNQNYPRQVEDLLAPYKDDKSIYKVISMTRNGDVYDVKIQGDIDATSTPED